MDKALVNDRVREHALQVARERGWVVYPADCTVTPISTDELRLTGQAAYWSVKILIRAAANSRRPLTKNGLISGVVRLNSGDSLVDTLTESPEALRARLHADDEI